MSKKNQIPVYSLDQFRKDDDKSQLFQIEEFDANRHFKVQYPHRHDFYEVLFLIEGSGIHIIDNNKYKIEPPCVFLLSPGQAHKLDLSHDIKGYIFLFTSEFYLINQRNKNRLLEFPFFFSVDRDNPPLYLADKDDHQFIKELFAKGCNEVAKDKLLSDEIIRSVLDLILLTCDQLYPEELVKIQKGKGHILVKNFLLLIEENYQNNLRVNDYADKLHVTANHLTQMVKQITGKTTLEIIKDKHIAEVKRLLIHSSLTVTEIAELMNFADQSYFTKYFKKHTGITPAQFRSKSMKST